jgi:hypothetical protein
MERDEDQIVDNVLEGDFGGVGPRQVLGQAMKDVESITDIVIVGLYEDGSTHIFHNEIGTEILALLATKMQGYSLMVVNDWEE